MNAKTGLMSYGYLPIWMVFKYKFYCLSLMMLNVISFGLLHIRPQRLVVRNGNIFSFVMNIPNHFNNLCPTPFWMNHNISNIRNCTEIKRLFLPLYSRLTYNMNEK